ncbi:hypothetical protein [Paenibacillus swuensis]|uniref:hypothetical protein n=1 Tax=Paenibacillus swuensis TaxID=1178515 RepID=UPI000838555C|nr:hypothetical protein [Paenibacillus swuensis]
MRKWFITLGGALIAWGLFWPTGTQALKAKPSLPAPKSIHIASGILQPAAFQDKLQQYIGDKLHTLSSQKGFENWNNAEIHITTLGPGTHGWLVLLTQRGIDVGYLVITADDSGMLKLAEYGRGGTSLFSPVKLYASMLQQELIPSNMSYTDFRSSPTYQSERYYFSALQSLWKVTVSGAGGEPWFLDGKTGEILPLTMKDLKAVIPAKENPSKANVKLSQPSSLLLPTFDPYARLPWVKKPALTYENFEDVQKRLNQRDKIMYTAEYWDRSIRYVFPVTGYESRPDETPYLIVEQDGLRYLPFHSVSEQGKFYKSS